MLIIQQRYNLFLILNSHKDKFRPTYLILI